MTIHPDGLKYRQPYTLNKDTLRPSHDHGAYIRGWVDVLDWKENSMPGIPDNPYSKYYDINRHYTWKAGATDAYNNWITEFDQL